MLAGMASTAVAAIYPANLAVYGITDHPSSDYFSDWSANINWFNQPLSIDTTPQLSADSADGEIVVDYVGLTVNGGAEASITSSVVRTLGEGVYGFYVTGTDDQSGTDYEGTATIGVDVTRPVSSCNAVVAYDVAANVTITANDALSGPRSIIWSLDGGSEQATPPVDTGIDKAMTAEVLVTTPGFHTLSWFSLDCAGNFERWHSVSFWVNPLGYTPSLGKPSVTTKKHYATIKGTVTPATSPKTVLITVQRKSGGGFKAAGTVAITVPRYAATYSVKKYLQKAGTYRVKAAEDAGVSGWSKSFTIR
jgi:hypothetical protein